MSSGAACTLSLSCHWGQDTHLGGSRCGAVLKAAALVSRARGCHRACGGAPGGAATVVEKSGAARARPWGTRGCVVQGGAPHHLAPHLVAECGQIWCKVVRRTILHHILVQDLVQGLVWGLVWCKVCAWVILQAQACCRTAPDPSTNLTKNLEKFGQKNPRGFNCRICKRIDFFGAGKGGPLCGGLLCNCRQLLFRV